jgi:uncharacterized C2H2 Zn-finger protein
MVKYSCEKCGKEFTQNGNYTKHLNKKNPCIFENKIEEIIEKVVTKKINEKMEQSSISSLAVTSLTPLCVQNAQSGHLFSFIPAHEVGVLNEKMCNNL